MDRRRKVAANRETVSSEGRRYASPRTGLYGMRFTLPRMRLAMPDKACASSVESFVSHEELTALMGHAGLSHVTPRRLTGGIAYIYSGTK